MPVTYWGCDLGDYWSMSVRPDIWAAGSSAWIPHRVTLAYKYHASAPFRVDPVLDQYSLPGAAEALILGGRVEAWPDRRAGGVRGVEATPCP